MAGALALTCVGEGRPACPQAGVERQRVPFELCLLSLSMYNAQSEYVQYICV